MSNFTTPMIEFKNLPSTIAAWASPRVMKEEKIRLIVQDDSDGANCRFYFLTTQKLLILAAERQPDQAYEYRSHEIYFLEDVYGIQVAAKRGAYGSNAEAREIAIRCGGNDTPSLHLDPQAADKFEQQLLSLLFDLKDSWE